MSKPKQETSGNGEQAGGGPADAGPPAGEGSHGPEAMRDEDFLETSHPDDLIALYERAKAAAAELAVAEPTTPAADEGRTTSETASDAETTARPTRFDRI